MAASRTTTANAVAPHLLEVIRSAEQELTGLLQRRAEITRRMASLKQMLSGLADLFGASILDDELLVTVNRGTANRQKGLTRACRLILMEARTPLRARQGCEELLRRFPELAQHHKDLRASVTTVFHRLAVYAEARCFLDDAGQRVWEWNKDLGTGTSPTQLTDRTQTPQASLRAEN
ncbi:MAG: hypothetical protein WB510_08245 [Candidatus Sulfotelmatobacter sp.]